MRTRFTPWLVAGAMLLASIPSHAQDAKTILEKVAATYKNARSYQAQMTMTQSIQMGGRKQQSTATVTTKFKAPNKVATIMTGGADTMQVYSDGKTMYIYWPKSKEYMKHPAPASFAQMGSQMASGDPSSIGMQVQALLSANTKKLADRNVGGKPAFVIQSTQSGQSPDGKGSFKMTITAFIDKASYMVRQIVLEASQSTGNQTTKNNATITFVSQQINPNLPDSVFAFKPPAGAKERAMQPPPGAPARR